MCSRLNIDSSLAIPRPNGMPAIVLEINRGRSLDVKPYSSNFITEALLVRTSARPYRSKLLELKSSI